MSNQDLQPLPQAFLAMTEPFDWDVLSVRSGAGLMETAYGWFHKDLDPSRGVGLTEDVLQAQLDQDRIHFAENYAELVLALTDLKDATWFRRCVLRKETLPETIYPRQRDHSVHTVHNYLLGWYFFTHCPAVTRQFRETFESRHLDTNDEDGLILRFGELWCIASLLHDVGYLFEGQIPDEGTALIDEGIRRGATWVSQYFQEIFWEECKVRGEDERQATRKLLGLCPESIGVESAQSIASYLRNLGSSVLADSIQSNVSDLPDDAFSVWAKNYRDFGQPNMAVRMEDLEKALGRLITTGIPGTHVRVLDHGICGGLLLLKYSTFWFRLYVALDRVHPAEDTPEAILKRKIMQATEPRSPATHWWRSVVWATASVALHNVQQTKGWPVTPLQLAEDPLAYLGILVDILQEWDRHAMRRIRTIESDRRGINSGDVHIGKDGDGKIHIQFGCRDQKHADRHEDMKKDLNRALADWESLVEFSFAPIRATAA